MDTPAEFKGGMYCHGAKPKTLNVVGMPNAHEWSPSDEDWNLPELEGRSSSTAWPTA